MYPSSEVKWDRGSDLIDCSIGPTPIDLAVGQQDHRAAERGTHLQGVVVLDIREFKQLGLLQA